MRHPKNPRCTECGKTQRPLLIKRDAGDTVHYFHKRCWLRFVRAFSKPIPKRAG